jgi:hypothetical protein
LLQPLLMPKSVNPVELIRLTAAHFAKGRSDVNVDMVAGLEMLAVSRGSLEEMVTWGQML